MHWHLAGCCVEVVSSNLRLEYRVKGVAGVVEGVAFCEQPGPL